VDYLIVDASRPGAGDEVRQWRVRCRKLGIPSLVLARVGGAGYAIEVRLPRGSSFCELAWNELTSHPVLGGRGSGSGSHGGDSLTIRGKSSRDLDQMARSLTAVILSHLTPERREAAARPRPPREELEHSAYARTELSAFGAHVRPAPYIRLVLPDQEYAVLQAARVHLAEEGPLLNWSAQVNDYRCPPGVTPESMLPRRLPGCASDTLESFWQAQGPYAWDERAAPLAGEEPVSALGLSRAGFNAEGTQAVLYGASRDFQGFLQLALEGDGWNVVEESHDADWDRAEFEEHIRPDWGRHRGWELSEYYLQMGCAFGGSQDGFCTEEERDRNVRQFEELVRGGGDPELLNREIIPVLNGEPISLRQLLMLGHDRGEIYWDDEAGDISLQLRKQGWVVLHFHGESPEWMGQLLAHLNRLIPCRHAPAVWELPELVKGHEELLSVLAATLSRAGFPGRPVHAARFRGGQSFMTQKLPGTLERLREPGSEVLEADHPLLVSTQLLESSRGFDRRDPFFHIMGELLRWADPEGVHTDRVWHAAGVESYRLL